MATLSDRLGDSLPGFTPLKTYAAWPVWTDSARAQVSFQPIPKSLANRYYQKARAWNRSRKIEGRYGGALGSAALRVLESLIYDFLNFKSGRCDPSYEGIARKTGLSRRTVATALARLRELRIIHWLRRCAEQWVDGRFELRQESNAYSVLPPSQWIGFLDPTPVAPPPDPATWGATPPMPVLLAQAAISSRDGATLAAVAALLDSDPGDQLAAALARLGRAIDRAGP